jgi:hypothetical protein
MGVGRQADFGQRSRFGNRDLAGVASRYVGVNGQAHGLLLRAQSTGAFAALGEPYHFAVAFVHGFDRFPRKIDMGEILKKIRLFVALRLWKGESL